jgi:putative ABC transport system permease protein
MLRSILAFTVRNLIRNGSYSLFAVSGLMIGITTAVLILLWVGYELRYDKYHPDNKRVYTILFNESIDGEVQLQDATYAPLVEFLSTEVPEVEMMTRINNAWQRITIGDKSVERNGIYADSGYFEMFHPQIAEGSFDKALSDKKSIVINTSLAKILFGERDAVGKFVLLGKNQEYRVTAVFADMPVNSSMAYAEFILPVSAQPVRNDDGWQDYYVKLHPDASPRAVEKKVDAELKRFFKNDNNTSLLFCLTDWRLHWNFENGKQSGGRIIYVTLFGFSALAILAMACINYTNMATARATRRAREIGVRKATGATQRILVKQFLTESLLLSILATSLSVLAVNLLLPLFRLLTGLPLVFSLQSLETWVGLACITLFTGLLAGSYPAFLLSSFRPALVLKGELNSSFTGTGLRKALVVFQFSLSVIMIFGALVMWQQTSYLLNKEVGYDKHNVINVWMPGDVDFPKEAFKAEVAAHPSVVNLAYGGASPMEINGYEAVKWPTMPANQEILFYGASTDFDMIPMLGFKFLGGRNFSRELASDSNNYVISKSAADMLGFQNPIGQRISYPMYGTGEGEIIGVINDFNNDDIHLPIAPVVFCISKSVDLRNLFIRYREGEQEKAVAHLQAVYKKFKPDEALNYGFLDSDYERQLYREKFLSRLALAFTVVAILIASLGLLGLTMFNAERRTKEIGIRKVLGASVQQVIMLLFREFLKPVVISMAIAFPIAYYFMQTYLESFPFRITISSSYYAGVGLLVFTIVLIIVVAQSFKAATKNPIEALKVD